jgi:predicted enzyme related to lactoylglutathione lyase
MPLKTTDYKEFIREIKSRIQSAQLKAAVSVNQELLRLYWDVAERIIARQQASAWGDDILEQISRDLQSEFPDMKGFSVRNLKYMRQWYQFWSGKNAIAKQVAAQLDKSAIGQQPVAQFPWSQNLVIISKIKEQGEALFYVQQTIQNNWSRAFLTHHIESRLYQREGKAVTNFKATLPAPQSDLVRAKAFYEWVFQVKLEQLNSGFEMWSFPVSMERPGVGGALVRMDGATSGGNSGTRVYFSCKDCAVDAAFVAQYGGTVYREKMSIDEYGFIALGLDTEGNMIGLHSLE